MTFGGLMIDLRSDTVTTPSEGMREAIARAPVGDDVYGEDPTVNRLQEMGAALMGKAAALFVPSGTMANQVCLRVLAKPGEEVIADGRSHMIRYEQGAAAALSGLQFHWVHTERGIMTPEQVEASIRPKDPHTVQTSLISVENTHNSGGGTIYPITTIEGIRAVALEHGIPMHLDGARLFNAVVATGVPAAEYAKHFETVSFCLSKGLGAPVGSLIAMSDRSLMDRLRRVRRMYGGAMRQAGILAAAGMYALEHNIARLQDDHQNAQRLAAILQEIPSVSIDVFAVETNIVFFDVIVGNLPPHEIVAGLKQQGVLINCVGGRSFRAVTHLDIAAKDIEEAGHIFRSVLGS